MKNVTSLTRYKVLAVIGVLVIGLLGVSIWMANDTPPAGAVPDTTPSTVQSSKRFSFEASKATDWKQGPSNETSMALFKQDTTCFVSVELKDGDAQETQSLESLTTSWTAGGYTVNATGTSSEQLTTTGTAAPYTLHRYAVTGAGDGGELYKAQAFGYVPLGQQHVKVQAYCPDDNALQQSRDALAAITLRNK